MIQLLDRETPNWSRFWFDFKGQEYYGTEKQLFKLKKMDKMNCRIAKIKKIQDAIHTWR